MTQGILSSTVASSAFRKPMGSFGEEISFSFGDGSVLISKIEIEYFASNEKSFLSSLREINDFIWIRVVSARVVLLKSITSIQNNLRRFSYKKIKLDKVTRNELVAAKTEIDRLFKSLIGQKTCDAFVSRLVGRAYFFRISWFIFHSSLIGMIYLLISWSISFLELLGLTIFNWCHF